MTEKDRCGLVLPMSCRGRTETFARNLHVRLRSLGIDDEEEEENSTTFWHQNGNGNINHETPSLSPEEETENPLSNVNELDGLKSETTIKVTLCNGNSEKFLESCSSVDEIYETASDLSDDESAGKSPDQDAFPYENPPKIRRCSSLKTGKTPPSTPGSKKIVRFADALGLDLADVKTFVDDIPKVPTSAYHDLRNLEDTEDLNANLKLKSGNERTLVPLFEQPAGRPNFLDAVRNNYVSLENALISDPISGAIRGVVRVRNVDFHKSVFVRYSIDSWRNFVDVPATYVENSCDGFSDKFTFLIYAHMLTPGQCLEFAVVFQARGEQFWDNNKGANYCFQCISTHTPVLAPLTHVLPSAWDDGHWGAAFY